MSEVIKKVIQFPNHRTASIILPGAGTRADEVLSALQVPPPKAVIVSIGSADNLDVNILPKLTQLYARGIARAALEAGALVIDGGTQAGVMSLMGEGIASHGYNTTLIGVAPAGKVNDGSSDSASTATLEPNHSHFVLTEGKEWGDETAMLFRIVAALTADGMQTSGQRKIPALVILSGGGGIAKKETVTAVRQKLPLIIIKGSGGLADEIAMACDEKTSDLDDSLLAEIVADGELHFQSLAHSIKGIERLIIRELGNDKVLLQAWETFADYDYNASRQQKQFERLQRAIILLGVMSVGLVIVQQVFAPRDADSGDLMAVTIQNPGWWTVYHLLILFPIVLTILITAANRFKYGQKWLVLRAGAEAIKREIYRYRSRGSAYLNKGEQQLSKEVEAVTRRVMRTDVNLSALLPYKKEHGFPPYLAANSGDDGFCFLTADKYVALRLTEQLSYYQSKTVKLEKQLNQLSWLTFIIGGTGTYLAAIGLQAWVALTTSIVTALGTFLAYRQTETTLRKYNQTATNLANVKAWWDALSAEEQAMQINIDSLVDHTEKVLQTEHDGWLKQMQNALADLRKGQEAEEHPEVPNEGTSTQGGVGKKTTLHVKEVELVAQTITTQNNHVDTKTNTVQETKKPLAQFE